MGTWRAVLSGEQARHARQLIDDIAGRLASPAHEVGLRDGAGRAILFAYLGDDVASDAHLDAALEQAGNLGPSLYTGISGLAFALAHLGHEVDDSVDEGLAAALSHVHHDLVAGIVGIGVYAIEHGAASAPLLARVIETLDAQAVRGKAGRALFTPVHRMGQMRTLYPQGAIDLGVAHGQGAAIVIAGAAAAHQVAKARALHDDLVTFLWSNALADGDTRFGAAAESTLTTRSAWCYGDPGLAAALFTSATAIGDAAGQQRALELARFAARRPLEATLATEPTVCHGALGLAHLYNRIAQASGDPALAAVANDWYARGLAMPLPEHLDLLEGQLGIALVLLAAISSDEPRWDRALAITAG